MRRRRPTGCLLGSVLALVAIAAVVTNLRESDATAARQLRRRLDQSTEPQRFSVTYQRGGTRVLDCVLANTSFRLDVDTSNETMVARTTAADAVVAVVDREETVLRQALFENPPLTSEWLRVPHRPDAAVAAALRRALGVDLAGYLVAEATPATCLATATAALDVATDVQRTAPIEIDGQRADGFRITVDRDQFNAAAWSSAAPSTTAPDGVIPVIDVWATADGTVARIAVSPQRRDGSSGPREDGWSVDYRSLTGPTVEPPPAADQTDIADVDLALLTPARTDCRLPG